MNPTIFYLTSCPVCEQGLVRVRIVSVDRSPERVPSSASIFVCDECDACWEDPNLVHRLRISEPMQQEMRVATNEEPTDQANDRLAESETESLNGNGSADSEKGPSSAIDLWSEESHWATIEEIASLGLYSRMLVAVPFDDRDEG